MKRLTTLLTLGAIAAFSALPAAARDFVHDGAGMFSPATVSQLNDRIGAFNSATGKEVVVVTVPSLGGTPLQQAAQSAFADQNVNGVLIFIARDDRRDIIVPDRAGAQAGWFTPDVLSSIRGHMEQAFHSENFDSGIALGVDGVLGVYREHVQGRSNLTGSPQNLPGTATRMPATRGVHISMFWWIIIFVVGFLILRSIMRTCSTPRYGPPGAPGNVPPGGMPQAGYGPGYGGYGGGGGSFWSGLLGGLGGAWLGNEMFGQRGGGALGPGDAGQIGGAGGDPGGGWGGDSGAGLQSDAGQADMGGSSGGDWSGGGFGDGGGGGDFGGGGDSGGGW